MGKISSNPRIDFRERLRDKDRDRDTLGESLMEGGKEVFKELYAACGSVDAMLRKETLTVGVVAPCSRISSSRTSPNRRLNSRPFLLLQRRGDWFEYSVEVAQVAFLLSVLFTLLLPCMVILHALVVMGGEASLQSVSQQSITSTSRSSL
jgi:hypothetical protein